jgi:hypothetical protein
MMQEVLFDSGARRAIRDAQRAEAAAAAQIWQRVREDCPAQEPGSAEWLSFVSLRVVASCPDFAVLEISWSWFVLTDGRDGLPKAWGGCP